MLLANGGRGIQIYKNQSGSVHAAIYVRHNTTWANDTDPNQTNSYACSESLIADAEDVQELFNIAATNAANVCGGNPDYAYLIYNGDSTSSVYSDVGWSAGGYYDFATTSTGFVFGPNNLFKTAISFVNATPPGAPNCGSATSVPNCMATVIANFTPQPASAAGYGYQVPSASPTYDPLFPQWLCNANLPAGLVTMGCLSASSLPAPVTITSVTVQ